MRERITKPRRRFSLFEIHWNALNEGERNLNSDLQECFQLERKIRAVEKMLVLNLAQAFCFINESVGWSVGRQRIRCSFFFFFLSLLQPNWCDWFRQVRPALLGKKGGSLLANKLTMIHQLFMDDHGAWFWWSVSRMIPNCCAVGCKKYGDNIIIMMIMIIVIILPG